MTYGYSKAVTENLGYSLISYETNANLLRWWHLLIISDRLFRRLCPLYLALSSFLLKKRFITLLCWAIFNEYLLLLQSVFIYVCVYIYHIYIHIYIYIYMCVCVCVCVCVQMKRLYILRKKLKYNEILNVLSFHLYFLTFSNINACKV